VKKKVDEILDIWHSHFSDKARQYSGFENSDIEYFVVCMLYNHFAFSKALDTMKTIDLSYDFLSECGDEYEDIVKTIDSIDLGDEMKNLEFLQNFVDESMSKYDEDELYLLKRLKMHLNSMQERYEKDIQAQRVEFVAPVKSRNPLDRL
jgi:hypothetical protein